MTKYTYIIYHKNVRLSFWLFRCGCVVSASPSLRCPWWRAASFSWLPSTNQSLWPSHLTAVKHVLAQSLFFKTPLWQRMLSLIVTLTWFQLLESEQKQFILKRFLLNLRNIFALVPVVNIVILLFQCKLVWEPRGCVFFFGYDCCDSFSGQFTLGRGERWRSHCLRIGKCWNWHLHRYDKHSAPCMLQETLTCEWVGLYKIECQRRVFFLIFFLVEDTN